MPAPHAQSLLFVAFLHVTFSKKFGPLKTLGFFAERLPASQLLRPYSERRIPPPPLPSAEKISVAQIWPYGLVRCSAAGSHLGGVLLGTCQVLGFWRALGGEGCALLLRPGRESHKLVY